MSLIIVFQNVACFPYSKLDFGNVEKFMAAVISAVGSGAEIISDRSKPLGMNRQRVLDITDANVGRVKNHLNAVCGSCWREENVGDETRISINVPSAVTCIAAPALAA